MDLYNDSHEKVCILSGIKETCITSTLKTGDKEITFEFRKTNRYATDIKEEGYIRTDTDEFVIKQVEPSGEWYKCTGTLNVEELEGKQYPQGFETVEKTVDECLTEAIDGTGWKVIRCDVSKKRTIRIEQNCSAWDVAQQAITTYRCEMVFDSLNKGISVYEKYGEDRGAYFIERLNLKRLQVQSNSYDFATRLIPIGKDGLMLNIDGKNYVENHQYSKKVKTMTWKDERYTDAESLKEDAEAKLDELSKPYRSYTAEIINLVEAVQDEEKKEQYKEVFSIALGDTVLENTIAAAREALQIAQDTQNTIDAAEAVRQAQERLREAAEKAREIKESRREDDTAKAIAKCVEAMEAAIEQTKKCLTATEEANKIIISQSGLDAILAAVKDYYERIRELETDININVDGGTPKSTDLLLVKGGTPFTTDYDKYIAGTSHTI